MLLIEELLGRLPSRTEFAKALERAGSVLRDGVPDMRKEIHSYNVALCEVLDQLGDSDEQDFKHDPELLYKYLAQLQEKVGGLQGIVIALNRRVRYFAFEDATLTQKQVGDKLKSYTEREKELFARSAGADLEGLEESLDSLFSNLGDRLYTLRSSVKGAWF